MWVIISHIYIYSFIFQYVLLLWKSSGEKTSELMLPSSTQTSVFTDDQYHSHRIHFGVALLSWGSNFFDYQK